MCFFSIFFFLIFRARSSQIYAPDYKYTYFDIDDSRLADQLDSRHSIILGDEIPIKYVVLHNSLPYFREEIVEFLVSRPKVRVTDLDNVDVPAQISPVWTWHRSDAAHMVPQMSTTKFKCIFLAKIPPMGLTTYTIHSVPEVTEKM